MNQRKPTASQQASTQPPKVQTSTPTLENDPIVASQQAAQIARRLDMDGGGDVIAPSAGFSRLQSTLGNQAMLRLLRLNSPTSQVQRAPSRPQNSVELLEENPEFDFGNELPNYLQDEWVNPNGSETESSENETQDALEQEALMTENPEQFDPEASQESEQSEFEDYENQVSRDPNAQNDVVEEYEDTDPQYIEEQEQGESETEDAKNSVEDDPSQYEDPVTQTSRDPNAEPAQDTTGQVPATPGTSVVETKTPVGTPAATTADPAGKGAAKPGTSAPEAKTPAATGSETQLPDPAADTAAPAPGPSDLVTDELAEHDRWGKYGAPGSDEREAWVWKNIGVGAGEGAVGGAVAGVGVHLLNKGAFAAIEKVAVKKMGQTVAKQALKHLPVPAVGAVVGGVLSGYNLITRDWADNWDNIKKGFTLEGKTTYEKIANVLQGISDLVDIISNLLNVVAGVAGAIAAGSWLLTIATAGALTPVAAAATSFAAAVSIITGVMDLVNGFVIQPAILAFRAMDAMDMDADPLAMEKAAKDIRGAAAGPAAALTAYAATPATEKGGKKLSEWMKPKEPGTANTSSTPAVNTGNQTPHVTVQPTPESVHLVQGDGSGTAGATSAGTTADAGSTAPKPQTETPAAAQTSTPQPANATPDAVKPAETTTTQAEPPAPAQNQTPAPQAETAPKPQTETPPPATSQAETTKPAETTQPADTTQAAETKSSADDATVKTDPPPTTRDEAVTRQQETQKKRDDLQKQIDATEKEMIASSKEMARYQEQHSNMQKEIDSFQSAADGHSDTKRKKWNEEQAANRKREQAEAALQKAREKNDEAGVAAAQKEIADQNAAAERANAEYKDAQMQETIAREKASQLRKEQDALYTDSQWQIILHDMAADERIKLLEQREALDADLQTTQQMITAMDTPAAPPAPATQPPAGATQPAEPPLGGAHGDKSRELSETHKKLIEESKTLKEEKAKIEKQKKDVTADQDELKKRSEENAKQMQENEAALQANVAEQQAHHYPDGMNPFQKYASDNLNKWAKRDQSWTDAAKKERKLFGRTVIPEEALTPPPSFNANNIGGSLAGDVFDWMLYPEENKRIKEAEDAEKAAAEMPPPETVNLSPAYSDPPTSPEAIASLRDQADDLEAQHRQMKQIETVEATEEAKGEAQKAQAEEVVTKSQEMIDLNREHGQKTNEGSEANKKQEAENTKAEGAVKKYGEQSDKFSSFQSVLGTVLGLEHMLDLLPDSVADYARSMFKGAHTMHDNLAQMNSGMGEVGAAGPQNQQQIADKGARFEQTKQENAASMQQLEQGEKGAQTLKDENEQKTAQAAENKAEAQAADAEILDLKAQKQAQADEFDVQMMQWAEQHRAEREQCVAGAAATAVGNGFEVIEQSQ